MPGEPMITLATDRNPWERQPRETDLMWARFKVFRDLGPETDRLRQTLEVLNSTSDPISYNTLKEYSSTYRWSARSGAWDRYLAQADRARMIKRRRMAIDEQCKLAQALRNKAAVALNNMSWEGLSPSDIVRFFELAYKVETSIFVEYAEVVPAATNPDAVPQVADIAAWSPSDRRKRLEQLREELGRRTVRAVDDDEVVA